ncbi:hypothetical protein V8E52_003089 [Russula decolorans]
MISSESESESEKPARRRSGPYSLQLLKKEGEKGKSRLRHDKLSRPLYSSMVQYEYCTYYTTVQSELTYWHCALVLTTIVENNEDQYWNACLPTSAVSNVKCDKKKYDASMMPDDRRETSARATFQQYSLRQSLRMQYTAHLILDTVTTAAAAASAAAVTVALAISIQPTRKKLIYSSPFRSMPKICMPFKEFEACMSVRLGRDSTFWILGRLRYVAPPEGVQS